MYLQTFTEYSDYVEQNCHVLITTFYNLIIAFQLIKLKENLKYWEQTRNLKKLYAFISYLVHSGTFIAMLKEEMSIDTESVWFQGRVGSRFSISVSRQCKTTRIPGY